MTNAHVTKVLFKAGIKEVEGVEVMTKNGRKIKFTAEKEVILSAGTLRSPQILMHSGVGPRKDLEKFDIPVVMDLPVGKNLQNHVSVGIPVCL